MPQLQLLMFPFGVTPVTALLAVINEDKNINYFNGSFPVFSHREEDTESFRMITAQFCVNGHTQQMEIVRAFGETPIRLKQNENTLLLYPIPTSLPSYLTVKVIAQN